MHSVSSSNNCSVELNCSSASLVSGSSKCLSGNSSLDKLSASSSPLSKDGVSLSCLPSELLSVHNLSLDLKLDLLVGFISSTSKGTVSEFDPVVGQLNSSSSPSHFESGLVEVGLSSLEVDNSLPGSAAGGNKVEVSLSLLSSFLESLSSLHLEGGKSSFADEVGLAGAEPIVPLVAVPESTAIFTSSVVVGLVLVPVGPVEEGSIGPHPSAFLEEIVSTNPNG